MQQIEIKQIILPDGAVQYWGSDGVQYMPEGLGSSLSGDFDWSKALDLVKQGTQIVSSIQANKNNNGTATGTTSQGQQIVYRPAPQPARNNTPLYVGLGIVGVLALAGITVYAFKH